MAGKNKQDEWNEWLWYAQIGDGIRDEIHLTRNAPLWIQTFEFFEHEIWVKWCKRTIESQRAYFASNFLHFWKQLVIVSSETMSAHVRALHNILTDIVSNMVGDTVFFSPLSLYTPLSVDWIIFETLKIGICFTNEHLLLLWFWIWHNIMVSNMFVCSVHLRHSVELHSAFAVW